MEIFRILMQHNLYKVKPLRKSLNFKAFMNILIIKNLNQRFLFGPMGVTCLVQTFKYVGIKMLFVCQKENKLLSNFQILKFYIQLILR